MQQQVDCFFFSAAVLLSACATTRMDAQWMNPDYQGKNVRGASVLVACEAPDLTVQRICEDQLGAAVSARGAKPTLNSQLSSPEPLRRERSAPGRGEAGRCGCDCPNDSERQPAGSGR